MQAAAALAQLPLALSSVIQQLLGAAVAAAAAATVLRPQTCIAVNEHEALPPLIRKCHLQTHP